MKSFIKVGVLAASMLLASIANAAVITATASLDYGQEVAPSNPTASDATGMATIMFDTETMTLNLEATVNGIFIEDITFPDGGLAFGNAGPFHIHNAPAGANGPIAVPFSLESYYSATQDGISISVMGLSFDSSILPELSMGNLYLNLHSLDYGSGEIRGQLSMVSAPTMALFTMLGLAGLIRRRVFNS